MKLVINIILASILSTFSFFGTIGAANPLPAFDVAYWFLVPADMFFNTF